MIEENLSAFRQGLHRAKQGMIFCVAVAFLGDLGGFGSRAEAAILYDDAAVSPSGFLLGENGVAKGLTISVAGVRLPFNPANPLRSVAFEIVQINSDPLNVAIALTGSRDRHVSQRDCPYPAARQPDAPHVAGNNRCQKRIAGDKASNPERSGTCRCGDDLFFVDRPD